MPIFSIRPIPGAAPADMSSCYGSHLGISVLPATNTKEEIPLAIRQLERL